MVLIEIRFSYNIYIICKYVLYQYFLNVWVLILLKILFLSKCRFKLRSGQKILTINQNRTYNYKKYSISHLKFISTQKNQQLNKTVRLNIQIQDNRSMQNIDVRLKTICTSIHSVTWNAFMFKKILQL